MAAKFIVQSISPASRSMSDSLLLLVRGSWLKAGADLIGAAGFALVIAHQFASTAQCAHAAKPALAFADIAGVYDCQ